MNSKVGEGDSIFMDLNEKTKRLNIEIKKGKKSQETRTEIDEDI